VGFCHYQIELFSSCLWTWLWALYIHIPGLVKLSGDVDERLSNPRTRGGEVRYPDLGRGLEGGGVSVFGKHSI
jgi:hypothetical protein